MPNSGTKCRQFGHLKRLRVQLEEIEIQNFGDSPKQVGVDIMFVKNLANSARIARQLLRKPKIAASLPFHFRLYCFSYVRKFVHPVTFDEPRSQ